MEKIKNCLGIAEALYVYKIKKSLSEMKHSAENDDTDNFILKFEQYKEALSSYNLIQQMKTNTQEFLNGNEEN